MVFSVHFHTGPASVLALVSAWWCVLTPHRNRTNGLILCGRIGAAKGWLVGLERLKAAEVPPERSPNYPRGVTATKISEPVISLEEPLRALRTGTLAARAVQFHHSPPRLLPTAPRLIYSVVLFVHYFIVFSTVCPCVCLLAALRYARVDSV